VRGGRVGRVSFKCVCADLTGLRLESESEREVAYRAVRYSNMDGAIELMLLRVKPQSRVRPHPLQEWLRGGGSCSFRQARFSKTPSYSVTNFR